MDYETSLSFLEQIQLVHSLLAFLSFIESNLLVHKEDQSVIFLHALTSFWCKGYNDLIKQMRTWFLFPVSFLPQIFGDIHVQESCLCLEIVLTFVNDIFKSSIGIRLFQVFYFFLCQLLFCFSGDFLFYRKI